MTMSSSFDLWTGQIIGAKFLFTLIDPSQPTRTTMEHFGPVRTGLNQIRPTWRFLDGCGPTYTYFDHLRPTKTDSAPTEIDTFKLVHVDLYHFDRDSFNWTGTVHLGPVSFIWSKLVSFNRVSFVWSRSVSFESVSFCIRSLPFSELNLVIFLSTVTNHWPIIKVSKLSQFTW